MLGVPLPLFKKKKRKKNSSKIEFCSEDEEKKVQKGEVGGIQAQSSDRNR